MDSSLILKLVESTTRKWTKQRKAEERGKSQASRRDAMVRSCRVSMKDAAFGVMEEAYMWVSANNTLPAHARQIYYAARPKILKIAERGQLDSAYFAQVILPGYMARYPEKTAGWDVVYDARGHLQEPHTEMIVPLGTLDVRAYLQGIDKHQVTPPRFVAADRKYPTMGPENRFNAILFIEKEGFLPLFRQVRLAERYDIAIMSTKGMSVVAARRLADELCGPHNIPLLVLHDFDKAGFSILNSFVDDGARDPGERAARYEFSNSIDVIDLGLRLKDVKQYGLVSEDVYYKTDPRANLALNAATKDEIKFLASRMDPWGRGGTGQRVELNAFASDDFIKWIESKLKLHGIKKVLPEAETLEAAYRRAVHVEVIRRHLKALTPKASREAAEATVPKGLLRQVRKHLKDDPAMPWDQAVGLVAAANCKKRNGRKGQQAS